MNKLKNLVDKHGDRLHKKKNVVGVATGKKWVNGKPTDEDVILVLVGQKEPKSKLSKKDLIEDSIEGVRTDVVGRIGDLKARVGYRAKERPAAPGISCGHLWVTAGTIGGVFEDREGDLIILSNNHVLAAENRGRRGHMAIQPGRYDGGGTRDRIGLLKYFRPLITTRGKVWDAYHRRRVYGYNVEDSAIAVIDRAELVTDVIKEIGQINGFNDALVVNETVKKTGRTTGYTTGQVIGLNADVRVNYSMGTLRFKDCILTTDMSDGGDSGSLLVDGSNNAAGLLFAGSPTVTVHNPIKYARATYGLKIYQTRVVNQSIAFVTKENSVTTSNGYNKISDAKTALDAAFAKAKADGVATEVVISYTATPE